MIPILLLRLLGFTRLPYICEDTIKYILGQILEETEKFRVSEYRRLYGTLQGVERYRPNLIGYLFNADCVAYWLAANLVDINSIPKYCAENMVRGNWFSDRIDLSHFSEKMMTRIRQVYPSMDKRSIFGFVWRIFLEQKPGDADYDLFFAN